ncbi:hypothetical protein WDW37_10430 [Bdellovibrionota bacterium FG-1]
MLEAEKTAVRETATACTGLGHSCPVALQSPTKQYLSHTRASVVWNTAKNDLPTLRPALKNLELPAKKVQKAAKKAK